MPHSFGNPIRCRATIKGYTTPPIAPERGRKLVATWVTRRGLRFYRRADGSKFVALTPALATYLLDTLDAVVHAYRDD